MVRLKDLLRWDLPFSGGALRTRVFPADPLEAEAPRRTGRDEREHATPVDRDEARCAGDRGEGREQEQRAGDKTMQSAAARRVRDARRAGDCEGWYPEPRS